jgi:hypothetical protein
VKEQEIIDEDRTMTINRPLDEKNCTTPEGTGQVHHGHDSSLISFSND